MTFSKTVISSFLVLSWALFAWEKTGVTACVFALCLLTFFATEAFDAYRKMAHVFSARLQEASMRADENESRIKQLVEAGLKMQAKINEMDSRITVEGIGKFAGLKR